MNLLLYFQIKWEILALACVDPEGTGRRRRFRVCSHTRKRVEGFKVVCRDQNADGFGGVNHGGPQLANMQDKRHLGQTLSMKGHLR